MQHRGRYRRQETAISHRLISCAFRSVLVAVGVGIILLLSISLAEYIMPDLVQAEMRMIPTVFAVVAMISGSCCGAYRLGRAGLRVGALCGLCYIGIALILLCCAGGDITIFRLVIIASVCAGSAIVGALIGILCR